jgi:hypothetical protein
MIFNKLLILVGLGIVFLAGCGGSDVAVNNGSSNINANSTNAANTGTLAVQTPTPAATTNDAPTLGPVYKAYCAAIVNKDEAAIRRIYSRETLAYFEKEMAADGEESLLAFLSDDKPSDCDARNEEITGDTGVAEIRSKAYPKGLLVVFVKEGGEWKLTNKRPQGALK